MSCLAGIGPARARLLSWPAWLINRRSPQSWCSPGSSRRPAATAGSAPWPSALDRKGGLSPDAALERLRTTTYDGITIEPLYTAADAPDATPPPGVDRVDGWDVRQPVDAAAGPGRAVAELERGATSILLDVTGLATIDVDTLAGVLDGVLLDVAPIAVRAGPRWPEAAEALLALYDRAGLDTIAGGTLGADPIGSAAVDGPSASLDEQLDAVAAWCTRLGADHPGLRVVTVDGSRFHDAGASDGQELGCTIGAAVEYLRHLEARGVDVTDAFGRIELRLAATGDQFATIAKFRAIRLLWARVADAVGAPGAAGSTPVHAVTSTAMMTTYDPWVNALRSTVACFAAGVAGADAVTVYPHDHLRGAEATELGRRIGRNTQSILIRESHLAEVSDPAGGSWYVERFTDELADAAWAWFQELESAGGLVAAATGGLVAERLGATREARRHDIDTRRAPLTGLTEFPNIDEPPPPGDGSPPAVYRWAAGFEALRRPRRPRGRVERAAPGRVPGHDRHAGDVHAATDVRQELLRGRRRGHCPGPDQRRPGRHRRGLRRLGRHRRVPLLQRHRLRRPRCRRRRARWTQPVPPPCSSPASRRPASTERSMSASTSAAR